MFLHSDNGSLLGITKVAWSERRVGGGKGESALQQRQGGAAP